MQARGEQVQLVASAGLCAIATSLRRLRNPLKGVGRLWQAGFQLHVSIPTLPGAPTQSLECAYVVCAWLADFAVVSLSGDTLGSRYIR